MARFIPKIGKQDNMPNFEDGSFVITSDTKKIFVYTKDSNDEIVRLQVGGDPNPQWSDIVAKPFEDLGDDFLISDGTLSINNNLKYSNRASLVKISEENNILKYDNQPVLTICGRVDTVSDLDNLSNPVPGMLYNVGDEDADIFDHYICVQTDIDNQQNNRWENICGDLSYIQEDILQTQSIVTPLFSTSYTYQVGQYVIYDGNLYKCVQQHQAGDWDATDFTLTNIMSVIAESGSTIISSIAGGYIIKGSKTYATLPSVLTTAMIGYVYNITDNFTTDSRFVEGAGKSYSAGTNVVIIDNNTVYTAVVNPSSSDNPYASGWYELQDNIYILSQDTFVVEGKIYYAHTLDLKFDVLGNFVDTTLITNKIAATQNTIAPIFDSTTSYAIGDYVFYEDALYKCSTAHQGVWSLNDFTEIQIVDELNQGGGSGNVDYTMIAAEFDTTQNYSIGDYVIYQNDLYKCTIAQTAGSWNSSNFEKTDVMTALKYNTVYTPTAAEISASITNIWG